MRAAKKSCEKAERRCRELESQSSEPSEDLSGQDLARIIMKLATPPLRQARSQRKNLESHTSSSSRTLPVDVGVDLPTQRPPPSQRGGGGPHMRGLSLNNDVYIPSSTRKPIREYPLNTNLLRHPPNNILLRHPPNNILLRHPPKPPSNDSRESIIIHFEPSEPFAPPPIPIPQVHEEHRHHRPPPQPFEGPVVHDDGHQIRELFRPWKVPAPTDSSPAISDDDDDSPPSRRCSHRRSQSGSTGSWS